MRGKKEIHLLINYRAASAVDKHFKSHLCCSNLTVFFFLCPKFLQMFKRINSSFLKSLIYYLVLLERAVGLYSSADDDGDA